MPTREVHLSEEDEALIEEGVAAGRYRDANDAIAVALHLLEREQEEEAEKLEWLRNAAQESIAALDRGEGIALESAEDIDRFVQDALVEARSSRFVSHA